LILIASGSEVHLAVEAGATLGWCEWVGDAGVVSGVDRFGAGALAEENFRHYGLSVDYIVARATQLMQQPGGILPQWMAKFEEAGTGVVTEEYQG